MSPSDELRALVAENSRLSETIRDLSDQVTQLELQVNEVSNISSQTSDNDTPATYNHEISPELLVRFGAGIAAEEMRAHCVQEIEQLRATFDVAVRKARDDATNLAEQVATLTDYNYHMAQQLDEAHQAAQKVEQLNRLENSKFV